MRHRLVLAAILLLFVCISGILLYSLEIRTGRNLAMPTGNTLLSPIPTKPSTPTPLYDTGGNPIITYTSRTLGVRFRYVQLRNTATGKLAGHTIEVGNTIYLCFGDENQSDGKDFLKRHCAYMEVLQKDPADTLSEAVQKQFLTGYSPQQCFVRNTPSHAGRSGYQLAQIWFPVSSRTDPQILDATAHLCPTGYTRAEGAAYFMEDSHHPNVYVFINNHQQEDIGDENNLWDETITFL